jgi:hypothetical protein
MDEAAPERTFDGRGGRQFGDNLMHAGSLAASRIPRPSNASVLWRGRQISPRRAPGCAAGHPANLLRRLTESAPDARVSKTSPARASSGARQSSHISGAKVVVPTTHRGFVATTAVGSPT